MNVGEAAKPYIDFAQGRLRGGESVAAVSCTMITVAIALAEAHGDKHEAIQLLHEMLGDLKTTN